MKYEDDDGHTRQTVLTVNSKFQLYQQAMEVPILKRRKPRTVLARSGRHHNYRHYLQGAYAFGGGYGDFKGEVLSYEKSKGYLFKYLFVSFMEGDGTIVDGKEDHVWVYNSSPLKEAGIKKGDKVSFSGTVYAYRRMDEERTRDYGIKNLENYNDSRLWQGYYHFVEISFSLPLYPQFL